MPEKYNHVTNKKSVILYAKLKVTLPLFQKINVQLHNHKKLHITDLAWSYNIHSKIHPITF